MSLLYSCICITEFNIPHVVCDAASAREITSKSPIMILMPAPWPANTESHSLQKEKLLRLWQTG